MEQVTRLSGSQQQKNGTSRVTNNNSDSNGILSDRSKLLGSRQNYSDSDSSGRQAFTTITEDETATVAGATIRRLGGGNQVDNSSTEDSMAAAAAATTSDTAADQAAEKRPFKAQLVWKNIILFVILHSCLPIGVYMLITQQPWKTVLFSIFGMYASGLGVTGGSHRLWSHRSYKAKWPVQLTLMLLQTMAGQNSIYTWSRDHRVHHKFSESDADPHNIKRGFFFAHMGWLCCKKHPDVKEKGKLIDMSDLEANWWVMFQHRNFWWLAALFTVLVPTLIPVLLWQERLLTSFVFSFMIRYLITLHGTWLVNSAAHYYGSRPYDTHIEARESPYVIYNGLGEGFHNYHHTFPYDYATSEFGKFMNITTTFIDFCAALGFVEERRKADPDAITRRRFRTGDLSEEGRRNQLKEDEELLELERLRRRQQDKITTTAAATALERAAGVILAGG